MVRPLRYSRQAETVIVSHRFGARKLWRPKTKPAAPWVWHSRPRVCLEDGFRGLQSERGTLLEGPGRGDAGATSRSTKESTGDCVEAKRYRVCFSR